MKKFYYLSTVFLTFLLIGTTVQSTAQTNRVVQPSSTGIQWEIGSSYNIVWNLNPAQCVDIYISTDGNLVGATRIFNNLGSGITSKAWVPSQVPGDYYIIITNCDGSTFLAASNNTFELVNSITPPPGDGTIHLIQPSTPGIQWESGTTHLISWDDDVVENLKLELWISGGPQVDNGVAGLDDAQNLSGSTWNWEIPATLGNNTYVFKILSTQTDVYDWGVPFVVTDIPYGGSNLTLLQPSAAGIQWESGTTHLISWTDDLIEDVKLELWISGGVQVNNGVAGLNDAQSLSGTTWNWEIPATLGNNTYVFKILSTQQTNVSDWGVPFEVTDTPSGGTTLTLLQPSAAGIQWESGTTHLISWTDDLIEDVKLELWISGGTQVNNGVAGLNDAQSLSGTTWNWEIPATLGNNTYVFKILSTQTDVYDWGVPFEVTDTPSGGSNLTLIQPSTAGIQWESGTTHLISWTDDLIENVKLELYISGGAIVDNEDAGLDNAQNLSGTTWNWLIPEGLANNTYVFKILSTQTGVYDWGVPFDIIDYTSDGEVIVLQPNGNEQWVDGNSYLISWIDNISEDVNIYVTDNDWVDTYLLTSSPVPGSTWTWNTLTNWPVGLVHNGGTIYKIKVSSSNTNSSATDDSNNPFSLLQTVGGDVSIIQPNGNEILFGNSGYLIAWDDDLVENVYVKLLKGGDDPEADLVPWELTGLPANAYSGAGIPGTTMTWNIPETGECVDVEEFDALAVGGYVADQLGGNWETWNGASGTAEDAKVSNAHSVSGSNSFVVDRVGGTTDLKLVFGGTNLVSGVYSFSNDIYIPSGKTGYWNLQNEVDYSGGWVDNYLGFEITYNDIGIMVIGAEGSVNALEVPYSNDTWYHNEIVVDLDRDWCDFYIDGEHIIGYQWSQGVHGGTNSLAFADFYALTGTDEAYFDNVCFSSSVSGLFAGNNYKIVVESIYDSQYNAISADNFTIQANETGGTYIDVLQPDGGEVWMLNTEHLMSWNDDVVENVDIDLVDANEAFIAEIANDVPGTTHIWSIDDALYGVGTYKVHIYSTSGTGIEDYSAGTFTIATNRSSETFGGIGGTDFSEIVLFPNPTSSQFTVAGPSTIKRIEVRNMLGQVMLSNKVDAVKTTIDIASFETGIYIVNVVMDGDVVTKKLFVH